MNIVCSLPLRLTIIRLFFSPLLVPFLLIYLLPYNLLWLNGLLACLFLCLALTDFLDGYLARKYNQESALGKVLDPIADKFLVYSTLIALLKIEKIFIGWVILLIGREFFIMGLRLIALEYQCAIPVSYYGKFKTMAQLMMLAFIIINPYHQLTLQQALVWNGTELLLIILAVALSLISVWQYYQLFIYRFQNNYVLEDTVLDKKGAHT